MVKRPCPGTFNEEVLQVLRANADHAQWTSHPCSLCGQRVGAQQSKGQWLPEQHWPTVIYDMRNRRAARR